VRGVLRHLGVKRSVTSPTYSLRQEYPIPTTNRRLVHIDAYRLRAPAEALGIGLLDDLTDPQTVLWIEWPERLAELELPPAARLQIDLKKTGRQLSWKLPTEVSHLV
jgi:tRNA threonylcarbamoyl adenosine modification protein YjeE